MQPIVFFASLFLGASAVNAQAAAVDPAAQAQVAAAVDSLAPTVYTTSICITATSFTTVSPTHGKLLCPECATSDQNITIFIDKIKVLLSIIPAFLGLTENGLSLDIIQNILNGLTKIIDAIDDFASLPIVSCLTIPQAALVLFYVTSLFGLLREAVNWVVFLGTVLSKIPILNTQLFVFVRDFSELATKIVNNLNTVFKSSGGCFNCSGVAIVNNEISQIQSDIKLFNQQFGQNVAPVPLLTVCDNEVTSKIISLCTSSVVTFNPSKPAQSSAAQSSAAPSSAVASSAAPSSARSGSVLPTSFFDSSAVPSTAGSSSAAGSSSVEASAVAESSSASSPASAKPSASVTDVTVVSSYTTCITSPGVVTLGTHTYTVTAPTTITVTDCPCTIPVPKTTAAAQVETTCDWTTVTTVVPSFTTYCPEPTTFCHADVCHTVTAPTTITVTNCPCTISTAVPVSNGTIVSVPTAPAAAPALSSSAAVPVVSRPGAGAGVSAVPSLPAAGVAIANAANVAQPLWILASVFGAVALLL